MKTRTTLVMRVLLALSLGIAFLAMNTVGTLTADANIENVKRSTVSFGITTTNSPTGYLWGGSGWIHHDKTTVVTAAHVIGSLSELLITHRNAELCVRPYGSSQDLRVNNLIKVSANSDVAILTLQSPYHEVLGLDLHDHGPSEGAKVTAVGTPTANKEYWHLGPEGTTKSGEVTKISVPESRYFFEISCVTEIGMSGGPTVLDSNSVVVGLNSGGTETYSYSTHSHQILDLMRSRGDVITTTISSGIPLDGRSPVYLAGVGSLLTNLGRKDLAQKYVQRLSAQGSRAARFLRYLRWIIRIR